MTDGPVIQPVSYRPPEANHRRGLRRFRAVSALGLVGLGICALVIFLFTARSVSFEIEPVADSVSVSGGLALGFGRVYLMHGGDYVVELEAAGHYPRKAQITVTDARNQSFRFTLAPLPGLVSINSDPPGAEVSVDGRPQGKTPLANLSLEAGERSLRFTRARYQAKTVPVQVEGRQQPQDVEVRLKPDWGEVAYQSTPPGARILIDGLDTGQTTPASTEILAGEREITLALSGHAPYRHRILIAAGETRVHPPVTLQQADAQLTVRTSPVGAGVTIDGDYRGESPLTLVAQSGRRYRIQVFKAGYAEQGSTLIPAPGEHRRLDFALAEVTGKIQVQARPDTAELLVDGRSMGPANQTLNLPTRAHRLVVQAPGHAGYATEITPRRGLTQELKVQLLTLAEARLAALRPELTTSAGQTLKLLDPSPLTLGASRREAGRRANEGQRQVALNRLFYLGVREVTNAEFRLFAAGHDSGDYEEYDLNQDDQPAVRVSWNEAALYCNWLSAQDKLPPYYKEAFGKVTGRRPDATGYRLPTEAEWAWAARVNPADGSLLRFPWGESFTPPDRHGNYADRAAGHLVGRVIFGYNDNHVVAAPVATYDADARGFHDLAGNVAEWSNDFYQHSFTGNIDPMGPSEGTYHVIKGSSWMHGTVTELRLSFRDYGRDGRPDLGFRIARFAESESAAKADQATP